MTKQTLKKKLAARVPTIGSWISLGSPAVTEIMARRGNFDWLVLDMEHTGIGTGAMLELIRIIDLCGCQPLVRVGANDPLLIKRALDSGAVGVVVPDIRSAAAARAAVAAAYYPPVGSRGVGLARAQGYGLSFDAYRVRAAEETVVVVQIEHRDAVDRLDEILSVPGIDAFMIGPYDLSASFGRPGDFDNPEVAAALERVAEKLPSSPVPGGTHIVHPDHALLSRRLAEGYCFVVYGVDQLLVASAVAAEGEFLSSLDTGARR